MDNDAADRSQEGGPGRKEKRVPRAHQTELPRTGDCSTGLAVRLIEAALEEHFITVRRFHQQMVEHQIVEHRHGPWTFQTVEQPGVITGCCRDE